MDNINKRTYESEPIRVAGLEPLQFLLGIGSFFIIVMVLIIVL